MMMMMIIIMKKRETERILTVGTMLISKAKCRRYMTTQSRSLATPGLPTGGGMPWR